MYALRLPLAIAALMVLAGEGSAQTTNYAKVYGQSLKTNPSVAFSTNRYLYDRYFRNNVAVSPYISGALLGGSMSGTAYQAVIRPDEQRRAAQSIGQARYVQHRKLQGNVGYTANPGAGYMGAGPGAGIQKPVKAATGNVGAYQNHWYGNWNR